MTFSRARRALILTTAAVVCLAVSVFGQAKGPGAATAESFPPLEQWKTAVVGGNAAALKALYGTSARVMTVKGDSSLGDEAAFWAGLKPRRLKIDVLKSDEPQAGARQIVLQAEVHTGVGAADHVVYVTEGQMWQQQLDGWKLMASKRSDATKLQQPASTSKVIYAPGIDAHDEIKHALGLAAKEHKNVLIVFGANWCYDCHVLDLAFHRPDLAGVLARSYEVVHIDVGEGDKNQDIMEQYGVPMKKGIPALAVLDPKGSLLYSQRGGEFEKARSLAPEDLLAFLQKWKPKGSGQ